MIAYLALGSNLGDRAATISEALRMIGELPTTQVLEVSPLYTTPPAYVLDQPEFLNGAATVETSLEPRAFLAELLEIEQALGRVRAVPNGPRSIDLDILIWGEIVIDTPELTVPHPALHERDFVLVPLADLAADVVHPVTGRTIAAHLDAIEVVDVIGYEVPVLALGKPD